MQVKSVQKVENCLLRSSAWKQCTVTYSLWVRTKYMTSHNCPGLGKCDCIKEGKRTENIGKHSHVYLNYQKDLKNTQTQ